MYKKLFSKRALLGVAAFCALAALVWWGHTHVREQFEADYSVYRDKAKIQEDAAFLPGTTNNPLRQQLNDILSRVLTKETASGERILLAQKGLSLISDANAQVDDMQNTSVPVREALLMVKGHANNPLYIYERGSILALVEQGTKELSMIEDIRGLSYRANFQTAEIFRRIIADRGSLTPAYMLELNSQIPQVEQQFNKRENLYLDLEASVSKIARLHDAIEEGL